MLQQPSLIVFHEIQTHGFLHPPCLVHEGALAPACHHKRPTCTQNHGTHKGRNNRINRRICSCASRKAADNAGRLA
eukprot:19460-Eustigmatos_ZCMA.PRE.1